MTFNSYTFAVFFLFVLVVQYFGGPWKLRKLSLLLASYLFYAAWNPPFVLLLWLSTVVDWFLAKAIFKSETQARRKLFFIASLAVNLGLLAYFKYGNFLLDNIVELGNGVGLSLAVEPMDIILPVGISFYTFQTLSYSADIYRRKMSPWDSFLDYALYVTFFPQLVAGPIVRASDFLPQCATPPKWDPTRFAWGLFLVLLGLFEKVVLADEYLAPVADVLFDSPASPLFADAWLGTLAFSGQIFCDFAGYSTCAIGVAMCLGFSLMDNFRSPYAAIGFSDFWRRWHISLSTWLRDYLYIPLGGNKGGTARTYVNLMLTMLIGGLWHGASWTFVVWGGLHGTFLCLERALKPRFAGISKRRFSAFPLGVATFVAVCFAWVFFRAESFDDAIAICRGLLGLHGGSLLELAEVSTTDAGFALAAFGGLFAAHWLMRKTTLEEVYARMPWPVRSMSIALMFVFLLTRKEEAHAFIYFQF